MSRNPYLKMYTSEMVSDTMSLSAAEFGQYHLLLYAMFNAGGSLPNDPKLLKRVCRGRVSPAVLEYFELRDGRLYNKRLTIELKKRENLSKNGQLSAQARAAKSLKNNKPAATDSHGKSQPYSLESIGLESKDTEEVSSVSIIPPKSSSKTQSPQAGMCLCPENWLPSESDQKWAVENGFTAAQIREARDTMVDWSRGNNKRRKNWSAVWRNWLRREGKASKPRRQSNMSSVFDQIDTEQEWHDFEYTDDTDDSPWRGTGSQDANGSVPLIGKQRS